MRASYLHKILFNFCDTWIAEFRNCFNFLLKFDVSRDILKQIFPYGMQLLVFISKLGNISHGCCKIWNVNT